MKIHSSFPTQIIKTISLEVSVDDGKKFYVTVQPVNGKLNPKYGINGLYTENMHYLNSNGPRERRKHFKQIEEYIKSNHDKFMPSLRNKFYIKSSSPHHDEADTNAS